MNKNGEKTKLLAVIAVFAMVACALVAFAPASEAADSTNSYSGEGYEITLPSYDNVTFTEKDGKVTASGYVGIAAANEELPVGDVTFGEDFSTPGNGYGYAVLKVNIPAGAETVDIVQVNSKSGLQGSNKNGAYAGGKFGGIGLTQSFAMELVTDRIKVNSVCPGNFFDGPLWSNPERGLFVQYLNSGKVPGARTIEDVKRFYEAKVPMNRGCFPADVAKAILYSVEQKYETGQAIPVTGGQVMLK